MIYMMDIAVQFHTKGLYKGYGIGHGGGYASGYDTSLYKVRRGYGNRVYTTQGYEKDFYRHDTKGN